MMIASLRLLAGLKEWGKEVDPVGCVLGLALFIIGPQWFIMLVGGQIDRSLGERYSIYPLLMCEVGDNEHIDSVIRLAKLTRQSGGVQGGRW